MHEGTGSPEPLEPNRPSGPDRGAKRGGASHPPSAPRLAPDSLAALQRRLGHEFRDPGLLERALTHPSFLHEHPEAGENNQRLEFLGDAVLQLFLTERLYHRFGTEREGSLTKRRAALGNGPFLAQLARELGLAGGLRLSAGEAASGGREREAALEDAFEAIVGAVYLDAGLAATHRMLDGIYGDLAARLSGREAEANPKGRLQELVQPDYGNTALRYEVVRIEGADHARAYEVAVWLRDRALGTGRGTSKKLAEEEAARVALRDWSGPAVEPSA